MTFGQQLILQALMSYGEREVAGTGRNSYIGRLIDRWFRRDADDSTTAWCAIWMSEQVSKLGHPTPANPFRAKSWEKWGREAFVVSPGSILVLHRPDGGYHVTVAVRVSEDKATVWCIGGNQSNTVNITAYKSADVYAVREPV